MRILACHNFYQQLGGEDLVFHEETALLEEYGHEVVRYTRHNDELRRKGKLSMLCNTIWNRETTADLAILIRRTRPDVMHCTNTFPIISPSAYKIASSFGIAVVQSLHNYRLICPKAQLLRNGRVCEDCLGRRITWPGILHGCYKDSRLASAAVTTMIASHMWKGTWHRAVNRFITPSSFTRQKLIEGGLPADKIIPKPNFVNPDPGVQLEKERYAVFVGRLSPEKGIETLLDAWSKVRCNFRLRVVGDGPMSERVRLAAQRDPQIERLGQLTWEQTMDVIANAACLVMPSIWYESFGRCIIEAYATGTPVIASRLGAMAELVEEGTTGLLSTPGDADDLAKKLSQLIDNPKMRKAISVAARNRFEDRFSKHANYRMLMDVYEQAIRERRIQRRDFGRNGNGAFAREREALPKEMRKGA